MVHRLILTLLIVCAATGAQAFDDEIPGLMLGGGVGLSGNFIQFDQDGYPVDDFFEPGACFDLRLGWGMGSAIFLFATARGSVIQYDTYNLESSDAAHGVFGIGMVQFFDRGRSPWYTTGHLGFAWFKLLEESQVDALQGFGFGAGFGYRWHPNLGVEFLAGWESTTIENAAGEFGNSILTFKFQIVGMAY